jgi:hypothetical protein
MKKKLKSIAIKAARSLGKLILMSIATVVVDSLLGMLLPF